MKKVFLTVREDLIRSRQETRDSIDQKLIEWILSLNILPIIISNRFELKHLKNLDADGLIISGGSDVKKFSFRYIIDETLLNWAKKNKKPVLGICYGMQFLSHKDGIKLKKINGHVKKNHKIQSFLSYEFPKQVNSYHNYGFTDSPKNYFVTAKDQRGIVEAIKHKKLNWHGWMWHPERDQKFNKKLQKLAKKIFNK